jgi:hypothetical protein
MSLVNFVSGDAYNEHNHPQLLVWYYEDGNGVPTK